MFDENQLVQQSLVRLGPSRIISRLNAELLRSIPPRPISRLGVFLAEDDYGLLITDMTAREFFSSPFATTRSLTSQIPIGISLSSSRNGCYNLLRHPSALFVAVNAPRSLARMPKELSEANLS